MQRPQAGRPGLPLLTWAMVGPGFFGGWNGVAPLLLGGQRWCGPGSALRLGKAHGHSPWLDRVSLHFQRHRSALSHTGQA